MGVSFLFVCMSRTCDGVRDISYLACPKCLDIADNERLGVQFVKMAFQLDLLEFLQKLVCQPSEAQAFKEEMFRRDYKDHREIRTLDLLFWKLYIGDWGGGGTTREIVSCRACVRSQLVVRWDPGKKRVSRPTLFAFGL